MIDAFLTIIAIWTALSLLAGTAWAIRGSRAYAADRADAVESYREWLKHPDARLWETPEQWHPYDTNEYLAAARRRVAEAWEDE